MLDGIILDSGCNCAAKYNNKMQLYQTVLYMIVSLGIAWIIIPLDINYVTSGFFFKSWNLFVIVSSLPSILLGIWLCSFPESPKFLLECGEPDEALEILRDIYKSNTGDSGANYPVNLEITILILQSDFYINFAD